MSEENLEKEQKGKNPLEVDIRFLKYYYTCYEHVMNDKGAEHVWQHRI